MTPLYGKAGLPRYDRLPGPERAGIDLHGLTVEEAEVRLIEFLNGLPKTVRMVEVKFETD